MFLVHLTVYLIFKAQSAEKEVLQLSTVTLLRHFPTGQLLEKLRRMELESLIAKPDWTIKSPWHWCTITIPLKSTLKVHCSSAGASSVRHWDLTSTCLHWFSLTYLKMKDNSCDSANSLIYEVRPSSPIATSLSFQILVFWTVPWQRHITVNTRIF